MSQMTASQRSYSTSFPARWSVGGPQAASGSPSGSPPPPPPPPSPPAAASSPNNTTPPSQYSVTPPASRPVSLQPPPARKYNQIFPKDWSISPQSSSIVQAPTLRRERAFGGFNSTIDLPLRPLHSALPRNQTQFKIHERIDTIRGPPPRIQNAPEPKGFTTSTSSLQVDSTESRGSAPPRPPNHASAESYSGQMQRAPPSIAHPVRPTDTSIGAYRPMGGNGRGIVLVNTNSSEDPWSAAPPVQPLGISTTYSEGFAAALPVPPADLSAGRSSTTFAQAAAALQPPTSQPVGEKRRNTSPDPAGAAGKQRKGRAFSRIQGAWGKLFSDEEGRQKSRPVTPSPMEPAAVGAPLSLVPNASNRPLPAAPTTKLGESVPVVNARGSDGSTASADVIIPWRSIR